MKLWDILVELTPYIVSDNLNQVSIDQEQDITTLTSMYQEDLEQSLFLLKNSPNISEYAPKALDKHPSILVTDAAKDHLTSSNQKIPVISIHSFERVANHLVKLFYQDQIQQLKYIAITGTNGKTTTCHMIAQFLSQLGKKTAIVGTLGVFDNNYQKVDFIHSTKTTPMYVEMAHIIEYFAQHDYDYIVYEATSIALDQQRTDFIINDLSVFTNFSPEHLEYHQTMERYLHAKLRLDPLSKQNLVNKDTQEYHAIIKDDRHYSQKDNKAYYFFRIQEESIELTIDSVIYWLTPSFKGKHNFLNITASIFALHKLGFPIENLLDAAPKVTPPPLRFEIIDVNNYHIILDFAHDPLSTKESIEHALDYAQIRDKKLNVMVTGIGLRGYEKIQKVVQEIPQGIEHLLLTAEQVGFEDPEKITQTMLDSLTPLYSKDMVLSASSRKEGIQRLIQETNPTKEIILLTGINEPQHIQGTIIAHDDQTFIESLLT